MKISVVFNFNLIFELFVVLKILDFSTGDDFLFLGPTGRPISSRHYFFTEVLFIYFFLEYLNKFLFA